MSNTPPHWTTRPKEPEELSVWEVSLKIHSGEPVYCGRCGDKLKITITHIICCRKCHPNPEKSGVLGAFRIMDDKILFDSFNGEYIPEKHLRFDPVAAEEYEKSLL